ncbi:cytochrome P450 [Hygrophoropsis aurantiaca]|uniref:Cytochrome P450 n=1 Tax=Hygrophoropsis aurantiaca TaxID=72124 RepID=A0ACB8A7M7_9AGAM|nr:cytochrome P450 [Hygrophoropsis aurantiaca]
MLHSNMWRDYEKPLLCLVYRCFLIVHQTGDSTTPSLFSDLLERMEEEPERKPAFEAVIKDVSNTTIAAASETIQQRGREEIETVVGLDRLPSFSDMDSLPFINAILRKCIRWQLISPIARPHATSSNDVYNGYFIPKDSGVTVIPNAWLDSRLANFVITGICRATSPIIQMSALKPDRWLDANGELEHDESANFMFGWGRRICPGRCSADATMWIARSELLANLEFHKAKDAEGKDIDVVPTFTSGFVR